jgi:cytochrome c
MFDTMVITKAVAGVCSALLILLLGNWLAQEIYLPHGEAPVAYAIDLGEEAEGAEDEPAEEVDIEEMYASADAAAGEALFRQCRACHAMAEGQHGVGPSLYGVVGREIGAIAGFNYSGALDQVGDVWTVEALNTFLENPRGAAPGTTMSYTGMRGLEDRLNLIAWMDQQDE